jgi:SAM-dependent methyltransferase
MYNLVSQGRYETLWRELVESEPAQHHEYFIEHKTRHYELFDNLAYYMQGRLAPLVLEVGVSGFSRLYKKLFPHIRFVMLDRPVESGGAATSYGFDECGAERYYNLDLNKHGLNPAWGDPQLGTFDYVIFCEVLEHLNVNPAQLIAELLGLLKSNGYLYLTTPNFFSLYHLQQIARGENPQYTFPRRGEDKNAGHHFREYGLPELVRFTEDAGGKIVKAEFSDCWEDEHSKQVIAHHHEWRRCLRIVASRREAPVEIEYSPKSFVTSALSAGDFELLGGLFCNVQELLAMQAAELGRLNRVSKWLHQKFIAFASHFEGI